MKNLSILGSTGSIGRNTLAVAERFPERFAVRVLTARGSLEILSDQVRRFEPDLAVVFDAQSADALRRMLPNGIRTEILHGREGYRLAAVHAPVDMVVSAMVGAAGLLPTLAAVYAGKDIALANKETLVMAGDIVMAAAAQKNVRILPVDSEHSAIFQCLNGNRSTDLEKILLTASGGPFLDFPRARFAEITPEGALAHPTWQMGSKISIDSATLMNKGLEVIEAKHLFGVPHDKIEVVVHPQSIVHSMVAFRDGAVIAQMGVPDMKGAIAYALSHPERIPVGLPAPDFARIGELTFRAPDTEKFRCLALAFLACGTGGTMPAVLNAANEIAVSAFLARRIGFERIPEIIECIMERHAPVMGPDLECILSADEWARNAANSLIETTGGVYLQ